MFVDSARKLKKKAGVLWSFWHGGNKCILKQEFLSFEGKCFEECTAGRSHLQEMAQWSTESLRDVDVHSRMMM